MVEVYKNLFVGYRNDYLGVTNDFYLCLCAKSYHQIIARKEGNDYDGYSGNMDKNEKEYLIAKRPEKKTLAVNLIDVPDVKYISDEIINECLNFIDDAISKGKKVLVACDLGQSRSASIAFMYLLSKGLYDSYSDYQSALLKFAKSYPHIKQGNGMAEYTQRFYENYMKGKKENA